MTHTTVSPYMIGSQGGGINSGGGNGINNGKLSEVESLQDNGAAGVLAYNVSLHT